MARKYDNNGQKDTYVDGGVLCNYPIQCFDGKRVHVVLCFGCKRAGHVPLCNCLIPCFYSKHVDHVVMCNYHIQCLDDKKHEFIQSYIRCQGSLAKTEISVADISITGRFIGCIAHNGIMW